ncbi:hypothetical protein Q3V23_19005 [Streptomyces sp. VNUA116]|uniref:hypothetical protein n=1 Tax=Streptomyces sp. VNUA116 TaxID=3062449 RepID=UPI00267584AB|nr:hypothetical protein [Streptomyces sp. VNUA116]WKU45979.1 hypothetical protein Q3V23_19005 [Streptomyces sp. VNUA116]
MPEDPSISNLPTDFTPVKSGGSGEKDFYPAKEFVANPADLYGKVTQILTKNLGTPEKFFHVGDNKPFADSSPESPDFNKYFAAWQELGRWGLTGKSLGDLKEMSINQIVENMNSPEGKAQRQQIKDAYGDKLGPVPD